VSSESDARSGCYALAIKYLAAREHSRAELTRKLGAKGYLRDLIEQVLDELGGQNLQSDTRYCQAVISSRKRKGYGPVYIRYYLKQKGVSSDLVDSVLDFNDPAWQKALSDAANKKFGADQPEDFSQKAKQMNFLKRRGFTPDQIRRYYGG